MDAAKRAARQPPAAVQGRRAREEAGRRCRGRVRAGQGGVRHRAAAPAGAAERRRQGTDQHRDGAGRGRQGTLRKRAGAGRLRGNPQPDQRASSPTGRSIRARWRLPGAPMLTVMDVSKVVARVNMAQDQARNVKVGNEATLTPADGGELVTGRVTIVSPASDVNSTTVQVWVQADNPGERLHAGPVGPRLDHRRHARRRHADPGAGDPAERRGRDDRPGRRRQERRTREGGADRCARAGDGADRRRRRSWPARRDAGRPRARGQDQGPGHEARRKERRAKRTKRTRTRTDVRGRGGRF